MYFVWVYKSTGCLQSLAASLLTFSELFKCFLQNPTQYTGTRLGTRISPKTLNLKYLCITLHVLCTCHLSKYLYSTYLHIPVIRKITEFEFQSFVSPPPQTVCFSIPRRNYADVMYVAKQKLQYSQEIIALDTFYFSFKILLGFFYSGFFLFIFTWSMIQKKNRVRKKTQ